MQVFVETHYYDGGFKSYLVPGPRRPDVLPSPELVGLRSTEAELADGDYALELAQFRRGSHHVSWLGCYTRGIDLRHGDRGTYCGVGVWLVDAALIHSLHLVSLLRDATTKIADGRIKFAAIQEKLQVLAEGFADLRWSTPLKSGAARAGTSATMSGDGNPSSYLILPNNHSDSFDLAAIDILGQFQAKFRPESNSRRLYFLAPSSRVLVRQTDHLAYKSALTYAEQLIHSADAIANGAREGRLWPAIKAAVG